MHYFLTGDDQSQTYQLYGKAGI